jgi:hypothetical protein
MISWQAPARRSDGTETEKTVQETPGTFVFDIDTCAFRILREKSGRDELVPNLARMHREAIPVAL